MAVTLVCVTFPLIWVGGLVTTYDAGMAVPDWPTTYGYNMFLYPVSTWVSGPWDLFIEHGHRLLGSLAGLVTIALNVAIWKYDSRRWMRWAGAAALLLVISQGLLGGMRVRMNSTDFARVHGCTGPLFFAVSVSICVMTSRFWFKQNEESLERRWMIGGWIMAVLAYLQLVVGAHLRHPGIDWSPGHFRGFVVFHVILAVVLLLQVFNVFANARRLTRDYKTPATLLVVFVFCQVLLGVATWRAKYGWPTFLPIVSEAAADKPYEIAIHNSLAGATVQSESMSQALTVTGHVAMGSLILAMSVCYATRLARGVSRSKTAPIVGASSQDSNISSPVMGVAGGSL